MNLQEIKHQFFAYRNGVVADALRRSGMPYGMIFGVDVPTLTSIANRIGKDSDLAEKLWAEKNVRESRLLATYLFDPAILTIDKAIELCVDVQTQEEADMLAFRVLRYMPQREELLQLLKNNESCQKSCQALSRHLLLL